MLTHDNSTKSKKKNQITANQQKLIISTNIRRQNCSCVDKKKHIATGSEHPCVCWNKGVRVAEWKKKKRGGLENIKIQEEREQLPGRGDSKEERQEFVVKGFS